MMVYEETDATQRTICSVSGKCQMAHVLFIVSRMLC